MRLSREVKTSLLILGGIILLIFGYNYLKGQNLLDSARTFYVDYRNVEGLALSTPVTINGLPVGKVMDIKFNEDGSGNLRVRLLVDNDFDFSKNSLAELYEPGLIGGRAIAIVPAFDGAEKAKNGDVLKGDVKPGLSELVSQRLNPLQQKIEKMMLSADSLLVNINGIFDEETKNNMKQSIAGLNQTISNFKTTTDILNQTISGNQGKIDNMINNADRATSNLAEVTESLKDSNLDETIKNFESTIASFDVIMADMKSGKGSIGKLLNDEGLYNNLEGASLQLEQLLQDMKLNPKRYVHFSLFGKKPKEYTPEDDPGLDEE